MGSQTRAASRRKGPLVLLKRGLVAFVLAGYVLALCASSAGHGWWLLGHVLTEHDPLEMSALRGVLETEYEDAHHDEEAHHHGAAGHGEETHAEETLHASATVHHHEGGDHDHAAASSDDWALHTAHTHKGHVHTHDGKEPAPAQLVIAVDKHCFISGLPSLVPPPARDQDFVGPGAAQMDALRPVETPPPRRAA